MRIFAIKHLMVLCTFAAQSDYLNQSHGLAAMYLRHVGIHSLNVKMHAEDLSWFSTRGEVPVEARTYGRRPVILARHTEGWRARRDIERKLGMP